MHRQARAMIITATTVALSGFAGSVGAAPPLTPTKPDTAPVTGPEIGPDFDADGYADLAVGAYGENVQRLVYAGTVTVLYGGPEGVDTQRSQKFDKTSEGLDGDPDGLTLFGSTLGSGDFNGDGFDDLVIGTSLENNGRGGVHVLFGGPTGLAGVGSQYLVLGRDGLPAPTLSDGFGASVVGADFDGDGYDELAIGASDHNIGTAQYGGAVFVVPGSAAGLLTSSALTLDENILGARALNFEAFGSALTAGDTNGDGHPDLVVGAFNELVRGTPAGAFYVVPGSVDGLLADQAIGFSQDTPGVPGASDYSDAFGGELAAGDLNSDGIDDVAVGASKDASRDDDRVQLGAVWLFYGTPAGLSAVGSRRLNQDTPGIRGKAENQDSTGVGIAIADLDGDQFEDLMFGSGGDQVTVSGEPVVGAGSINVIYGSDDGLTLVGNELWSQLSNGVADTPEYEDGFGSAVVALDLNGDGLADLATGVDEDEGYDDSGAVHVLYGTTAGLSGAGSEFLAQGVDGVPGSRSPHAFFGGTFTASAAGGSNAAEH